jgi:hypothetical protein
MLCRRWKEATPFTACVRQSIKLKLRGKDRNFADTRTFRAQGNEYREVVEAISYATQLPREDTKRSKASWVLSALSAGNASSIANARVVRH